MRDKCTICGHDKSPQHTLKPNGKILWWWTTTKVGKKVRDCSCRECEEFEAIHAGEEF